MTFRLIRTVLAGAACALGLAAGPALADPIEDTLADFVRDYGQDPMAQTVTFGLEVDGRRWHVVSDPAHGAPQLNRGFPSEPIFYFTTSSDILRQIHSGELSGLTAMAAATSADITPLDVAYTEGYERPSDYDAMLRPLIFHFWTRGFPETVPLLSANTRIVHGAPGVVMYYYDDFRSAIYHVPAGLGQDQAPTMAIPFPRILVTLSGTMTGTVGGRPFTLPSGNMVLIPPNEPAQVWNDEGEQLTMLWLMFGEGA